MLCRLGTVVFVLAVCLSLAGCGSDLEKVQAESTATTRELADILETIKTREDLTAARPRLEQLGARLNRLSKQKKDLPVEDQDKVDASAKVVTADKKRAEKEMQRIVKSLGIGAAVEINQIVQVEKQRVNPY